MLGDGPFAVDIDDRFLDAIDDRDELVAAAAEGGVVRHGRGNQGDRQHQGADFTANQADQTGRGQIEVAHGDPTLRAMNRPVPLVVVSTSIRIAPEPSSTWARRCLTANARRGLGRAVRSVR